MGEVHDGSTVMDFMEMERERGITIGAAATSFRWGEFDINLIDTPGHVDFSAEVERSVTVLDGAILVLDAVAGVQAQTETVWNQTVRHSVPAIAFLNKMDRDGANPSNCLSMMKQRLSANPLMIQLPLSTSGASSAYGHVDLISKQVVTFSGKKGEDMEICQFSEIKDRFPALSKIFDDSYFESIQEHRQSLIEHLVELDDDFAEVWWKAEENGQEPTESDIHNSLRRITLQMKGVPVLCGSALKYVGIQPLMTASCSYLPSPLDRPAVMAHQVFFSRPPHAAKKKSKSKYSVGVGDGIGEVKVGKECHLQVDEESKNPLAGLAFKVKVDPHRGPIVWVRVYNGQLKKNMEVWNTNKNLLEKVTQLYKIDADAIEPAEVLNSGEIGAAVGLTETSTGHTLSQLGGSKGSFKKGALQICQPEFIPPVFLQTIETDTMADQAALDEALGILQLEDPTFHVKVQPETEEVVVCGLGELHLQIIEHRLNELLGAKKFRLGSIQVSYRYCFGDSSEEGEVIEHHSEVSINGKKEECTIKLRVQSTRSGESITTEESDHGDHHHHSLLGHSSLEKNSFEDLSQTEMELSQGIQDGVLSALFDGNAGIPVINAHVDLLSVTYSSPSPHLVFMGARNAIQNYVVNEADLTLLEPVMRTEITVDEAHSGAVISELTRGRKGTIQMVQFVDGRKVIEAIVPLKNMLGYSSVLRSIASGNCSHLMEFCGYDVSSDDPFVV
eukprot:CAMPEP_0201486066 /NCGR_PEP_ID=MMETSP0151_2-20130828/10122_1 /ASSEMBLY_ACC=CAM_ASM_000257 /TAXON_ID=200890 /ORGANISM="Paramoeba atlantica, Strain 621/1 / CCAP 1560/9" /LENGTH=728 /DNA_ID=CAMNT_0047870473 /DNA_START=400 /DNA_END=2586 /DNA_ORIENTATION=+